ncbi:hemin uptake protein HemP [Chromobacterium alkanivorans]|uniref:hemin uptake protein HemP n=1 Tax=Chromobacterium alkanivorans TaxID=1071719 RepID=UPI002167AF51|nr:hemin uptake protein HemP [Chromobacterium alkanivorans]MCS3805184.1 hemin uptake protein HemP [Chromobacterium alkanivorans]MCS3819253.1 hemin uptake protein HemP [Chromobacterium alkanivorans]MCS3873765.1 hemin uptake protein HemP [Chromobacterium alkanivorans]
MHAHTASKPGTGTGTGAASLSPVLRSCELFAKGREILIEHQGEMYRLQLTRNGKLILIK